MMTKEIIQHLEQVQRNALEKKKTIEEISQCELDQIHGARAADRFSRMSWDKSL